MRGIRRGWWPAWLLAVSLLAGCSSKTVDYRIEGLSDTEENTMQASGQAGIDQFAQAEYWTEEWTVTDESGEQTEVSVDAEIIVPDAEDMYVVSVAEPDFGEAARKQIAEACFAGKEVYYYDELHLPKEQLKQRITEYEKELEELDPEMEYAVFCREQINTLRAALETASDTYLPAERFDTSDYMGYRDGIAYQLNFGEYGAEEYNVERAKAISLDVIDIYSVVSEDLKDVEKLRRTAAAYGAAGGRNRQENHCTLTPQQAKKEAAQILEGLGFSYPVYAYTVPLVWGSEEQLADGDYPENGADWLEGYSVHFEFGIENLIPEDESDYNASYWNNQQAYQGKVDQPVYSMNSFADVELTDRGIVSILVYNPVEIKDISQPVRLLPLDTVCDILRTQIQENFDTFHFQRLDIRAFNQLELTYFRVTDREHTGQYSYIPVWRLANAAVSKPSTWGVVDGAVKKEAGISNEVMINAMDGSVVRFSEEYFGSDDK